MHPAALPDEIQILEENPVGVGEYAVIGKSILRDDGYAKVTGKARFSADMAQHNMLIGKILYSSRPHARILKIDPSKAQALPGVEAVITSADAPDTRYGAFIFDRPILARERVRYVGEPVAAVAAISEQVAIEALKLIEVEYQDLPAVFDFQSALPDNAPQIHPQLQAYAAVNPYVRYGNVCMDARISLGDADEAFHQAHLIFENTFTTQPVHQGYLEPHACISAFDHTGRLTVWMETQQLSWDHASLARALNLPMTKIRLIPTYVGGGFGGKLNISIEPICCILTQITGRPVAITLTREEEFFAQHPQAPYKIILKTGVAKDGRIIAQDADILVDAGAYADQAVGIATKSAFSIQGCYSIPNCRARTRVVYTNNVDWGCMRGYGTTQPTFALETQLDMIAKELGMDPAEIRLRNLCQEGDSLISGQSICSVHIRETMEKALATAGYWEKKNALPKNFGIGIANVAKTSGLLASSASIRVNEDATVSIGTGIVDIGTGAHTVFRQIAAEVLGIPIEKISIASQDSDSAPFDIGSQASRTIFNTGNAVRIAAEDVRYQMLELASKTLKCDKEHLMFKNGSWVNFTSGAEIGFEALVGASLYAHQGPLLGHGSYMSTRPLDKPVGEGFYEHAYPTFTFSTQVALVEVDPQTGKIEVREFTSCHDIGKALHPNAVEGQIEGAVLQGIGLAILEEIITQDGVVKNPNLVDYRMPTAMDAIDIKVILIEEPDEKGPFGAKGIGEAPIIGVAPAIANAIFDATGVMVKQLPIHLERLFFAIQERNQ